MRHRAAALLAEGGCKTPSLRQVEACDRSRAAKPANGRCLHDHLTGMGGPVAFRHREQWQFKKRSKGPSTSNTTSPQMQLPRYAAILTSLGNRMALVAALASPVTSAVVLVFGRRYDEPFHALWRPASKKRQGTKSREVGHRWCNGRYGDLMAAPSSRVDVTPTGCGRRICTLARSQACNRHLGKHSERINGRTVRRPR